MRPTLQATPASAWQLERSPARVGHVAPLAELGEKPMASRGFTSDTWCMEASRGAGVEQAWPLFGLSLAHQDLLLREATDDDVLALARVVEEGIVEEGDEHFMPRLLLGRAGTVEARFADFLRYHWGRRAATSPESWVLAFAVVLDDEVVGSQAVHTTNFPVIREVHTGSYLARRAQGRGVGKRIRAIVLELSFGHFGAHWARAGSSRGTSGRDACRRALATRPTGSTSSPEPGMPSSRTDSG